MANSAEALQEALKFLKSPDPDLNRLTREPGGDVTQLQGQMLLLRNLARGQEPLDPNRRLAVDLMTNGRPFREVSFPLSPSDEEILLRLRIIEPGKGATLQGTQERNTFVEGNTLLTNHRGHLLFQSSAWGDRGRWSITPMDPAGVSLLLVSCVAVIVDSYQRSLAVPSDTSFLHPGHA